ncbi:MAG: FIST C-terminal domain-containing protein [Lautropia sp.]|nr:FIST C-terminal domain-containing protein [Lautropia sp.]
MNTLFRYGHATHPQWRMCTELALEQVERQVNNPNYSSRGNLGFVYIGAPLAECASEILMLLKTRTRVIDWVGTVGSAILSSGVEYRNEPAIAIMIAALPPGSFSVFSGTARLPSPGTKTVTGADAAWAALVHADPGLVDLEGLIHELSGKVEAGYLFGGLSSGDIPPLPQIANHTFSGGMSGVAFASDVGIRTRVTQGCSPLAADHRITACEGNLITSLDDEPALDTLLSDLDVAAEIRVSRDGERLLDALPAGRLRNGLFAGIAAANTQRGFGFADYRVRNVVGIDPLNRLVAIAEQPEVGERLIFCTRDARAARQDLIRMTTELREEIESEGHSIRGGIYVSCVARGEALFGDAGHEMSLIKANLGDFPLVGFYANGEIARDTLYGYTGVLTLFI